MDAQPAHPNRDSFRDYLKGFVALEIIIDLPFGFFSNKQQRGSWGIFGDSSVTLAQWWRARDLTNFAYPQVPGSIPAETTSTQIHMGLNK